jgi:endonuclease IV
MAKLIIGIHVAKEKRKSLTVALEEDIETYRLGCAQVFTHGPQSLNQNNYDEDEIKEVSERIPIVAHSPYKLTVWNKKSSDHKYKVKCLVDEMLAAANAGISCVVVHLLTKHAHSSTLSVLDEIRDKIIRMSESADKDKKSNAEKISSVILVLEHKAHKYYDDSDHDLSYTDSKSFAKFLKSVRDSGYSTHSSPLKVGFCLDTAHMFVSHDDKRFSDAKSMKKYLKPLIPYMDMMAVFHFNGSYYKHGMGKDKHAIPFSDDDYIWSKDSSGAIEILSTIQKHCPKIPIIIEWNAGDIRDIRHCFKKLVKMGFIE